MKQVRTTKIATPNYRPLKRETENQRRTKRKKIRRRATIQPVIDHLKPDFRLSQNYLLGDNSPQINALLAATGWNLKKRMRKLKEEFKNSFFIFLIRLFYPKTFIFKYELLRFY